MNAVASATVIGTGLIGTSAALALRGHGVDVRLDDRDADAVLCAVRLGAGVPLTEADAPADLVILAVPPAQVADVLYEAQKRELGRCYSDVCSVKAPLIAAAARRGCELATFVPGHPMAGSEHKGPASARSDLFAGRAWALCPTGATEPEAVETVRQAVCLTGAVPCIVGADEHDRAAALISHVPHIVSSAMAARLVTADPIALRLAGRGLLDVTRVAAGDVSLWTDILTHNAKPLAAIVASMAADLRLVADELHAVAAGGPGNAGVPEVAALLLNGNAGRHRLLTERSD